MFMQLSSVKNWQLPPLEHIKEKHENIHNEGNIVCYV
jgi:hypothetical protein